MMGSENPSYSYQPPAWVLLLFRIKQFLLFNLPPGKRWIKLSWVVNFQKGVTFIWVYLLIILSDNNSWQSWLYLSIHGSYGICWLLKDFLFPDKAWQEKVTVSGAVLSFLTVLGPYWLFPVVLITDWIAPQHVGASQGMSIFAVFLYVVGLAIMLIADAQKYFILKIQSGLIDYGIFSRVRHPNYTGEMMIYSAFAILVWHWLPWIILAWVWLSVFSVNILMKESSLSRYSEWQRYTKRSGMLFPKILIKSN